LSKNRFFGFPHHFKQIEILNVARSDLNDVRIFLDQLDIIQVHDFCDNRQACLFTGLG